MPQPIVPREYRETDLSIPIFPLPFHIRHFGEPLYPPVLRKEVQPELLAKMLRENEAWCEWMYQQDDADLLFYERSLFERIQLTGLAVEEKELTYVYERLFKKAQELREQGNGELIDRYWPHLSQILPSDE